MPIALLFDLANYTPADASPVQANFQQIEQFLNTEVIGRDGLVAMVAALRLANSTPLNALDAASKGYVDNTVSPISEGNKRAGVVLTPTVGQAIPLFPATSTMTFQAAPREDGGDWWSAGSNVTVPAGCGGIYQWAGVIDQSVGASHTPLLRVNGGAATAWGGNLNYIVLQAGDVLTFLLSSNVNPAGTTTANSTIGLIRVSA